VQLSRRIEGWRLTIHGGFMSITEEERSELLLLISNLPEQERQWKELKEVADDANRSERCVRQAVEDSKKRIDVLTDKLTGTVR
jgi:hypothetical protein